MSESYKHKLLKKEAVMFLRGYGYNDVVVKTEIRFNRFYELCVRGEIPIVIMDCVAFCGEKIIAGVECGNINPPLIVYSNFYFPVYHLRNFNSPPHFIGQCSYCSTSILNIFDKPKDWIFPSKNKIKLT